MVEYGHLLHKIMKNILTVQNGTDVKYLTIYLHLLTLKLKCGDRAEEVMLVYVVVEEA